MTRRQSNKRTMFLDVQTFLAIRAAIMNSVVNYSTYSVDYNTNLAKLCGLYELQQYDASGNTDEKRAAREKLTPFILEGSSRLMALSVATSNLILVKEVDYSISDLREMDENSFVDAALAVKDRIQANLVALASYGSNATTQANFQAAITAYTLAARKPATAQTSQKVTTEKIEEAIVQVEIALYKIDSLVNMLRFQQPDFYKEYWFTRRIGKKGIRYTSVICRVLDVISKETIKGVSVVLSIDPSSPNYKEGLKPIEKKSADKGGFMIKNLNAGIYQVVAKKLGYKDSVLTVAVNDSETTRIVMELEKMVLA